MSHYSHKLWRALALALILGLGLVALGTRNVSATINPLEIIGEVGVASIDPSASAGTWYLRYTGNPAPTGYSHAYQWAEPQIVCSPDDIPTTFDGTLDVTNISNGDVAFIGLLDKGLMGTGSTGYQSGAYMYVLKLNATTLRVGPSDGNKNGEIIQIFQNVTIPVDNTLNVTLNIDGTADPNSCASGAVGNGVGCITVTVENQIPMTDSYGDVKSLNNAVTYSHHEFEYGAYPGWDDYGTANILYDLEVTGCGVTEIVRPVDMSPVINATDWHIAWIEGSPTYSIVPGPATPPLGTASLQMTTGGTADKVYIMNYDHAGVKLADITTLGYSTYGDSNLLAPVLQLQIDPDGTGPGVPKPGGGTTNFATVSFEPYFANTVTSGVWQTWDVLTGGASVWASNVAGDTGNGNNGTQNNPATWAEFVAFYPDATISGGFGVNVGKGWTPSFTGHVDALQIGYGGNMVTYDFEPNPPCTTVCYADVVNGNDANSGSYANDAKKTIQAAVNQVSAGGQVIVAQGVYSENVVIPKSLTLTGNGQQDNNPGTRLDGTSAAAGPGIFINTGVKNVKIENLRVKNYNKNSGQSAGIWANGGNDGLVVQNVTADNNGWAGYSTAGIYANGPVDNVLIDHVTATNNKTRGIVIWNGFKTNITITNNTVKSNNCCGIELQDGTASGVTVTGNTVESNTDSGMAFTGLMAGAGPNLIANNTVKNNGRFGIEIKLPNGTGAPSGDGSIVVENNTVSLTSTPADLRDYAGIAVFRRGWSNVNANIPTGVIVRNNTVSGYVQNNGGSNSTGFGIVVEGTNMTATGNTLNNNDVGVQAQAGHTPYTPNTNIDGDQSNLADDYFGRGNSPQTCANIGGNTFSGNGVDTRFVGNGAGGLVTNIDTGETFCSIQAAIDDSDTVNGHTIQVSPGTYAENVVVNKELTIKGANAGVSPNDPITPLTPNAARGPESEVAVTGGNRAFSVQASNVTIDGFKFTNTAVGSTGNIQSPIIGAGLNYGGITTPTDVTIINNLFFETSRIAVYFNGPAHIQRAIVDNNRVQDPTRAAGICGTAPTVAPGTCGHQLFNLWKTDDLSFQGNVTTAAPGQGDRIRTLNISDSTNVLIAGNTVRNTCTYSCVTMADAANDVEIKDNDMVSDVGNIIQFHPTWSNGTVNVRHNILTTGSDFPIAVDNTAANLNNVHINRNAITGGFSARNGTPPSSPGTNDLDATCNWWGATPPLASKFYGPVSYASWLVTGNLDGGPVKNTRTGKEYCSIQAAIDDPSTLDGDTIEASANIYPEQVTINKSIHLVGAGAGQSIIQAPATMPVASNPNSTIVKVTGTTVNAEITGFTITGPGPSSCGSILSGIFVRDGATAEIHHNTVADIRDTGQSGCQNGRAIMVGHLGFTTSGTADIHDNTIVGYQKTGILVAYTGSYATVTDNIVQGAGKVGYIAMNGIDVGDGASADVTGNTVSGNWYTGANWTNAGIILFDGGASNIANNTVTENMLGVYIYDSPATVASNTITTTWAGGSSSEEFAGIRIDMSGSKPATAIQVTDNQIIGDNSGHGKAISAPFDTDLIVTKNIIQDWRDGVEIMECAGDCNTPPSQSISINRNSITGIGVYGINNDSSTSLIANGTCNWWGDASGPGPVGPGSGSDVSTDVDFGPWLRESNLDSYLVTNTDTGKVFCGIQQAIDDGDTDDGDTITVSGGWAYPYSELVDVYKAVHLIGAGAATTTIEATTDVSSSNEKAVIQVRDGKSAEITGFTIAGPGPDACGSILTGIFVREGATANIHDNTITAIRDNDGNSTCQNGFGIFVGRKLVSTTGTATITNNTLTGYQKGGIIVDNTGSNATLSNNIITGSGSNNHVAQNGVQISRGATATFTGNDISLHQFSGSTWIATGVLLYDAGNVTINNNNLIHDNGYGIYIRSTGARSSEADGPQPVPFDAEFDDLMNQGRSADTITAGTMVINNNQFYNNMVYGAYVTGMSGVDGRCNWWGNAGGPSGGNKVSGGITVIPFRTSNNMGETCNMVRLGDGGTAKWTLFLPITR